MESQELSDLDGGMQLPTIKCPKCLMIWLAPGIVQGDSYQCRNCGASFVVAQPADNQLQVSNEL